MEEGEIKKIAELREVLEEKIKNLEAELERMKFLLEIVNRILVERSFRRAGEISKIKTTRQAEAPLPAKKILRTIPLKTSSGELLARMYVEEDQIRIVPAEDKEFDVNIPPFNAFLIDKILEKMKEKDEDLVRQGKLMPSEVLSYEVEKEGNILREIRIRNADEQREREIRSATRWTLEKMYEKIISFSPDKSSKP